MRMKSMRHLLLIPLLVFLCASSLIFFFGDSGLRAFQGLERYKNSLAANVASLEKRNRDLSAELSSLRDNPERNILLARTLGLYRSGEAVVRLEGTASRPAAYTVGDLLKMKKPDDTRSAFFKAAAVVVSLLLLAYAFLSARASRRRLHGSHGG
jgi:cell division protein FtsB